MEQPAVSFLSQTPLRVECAWCNTVISAGREPVSHGICKPCIASVCPDDAEQPSSEEVLHA